MTPEITIHIPMPLILCVEDVGWWSGQDGSRFNQPYRTGMPRDHVPEDYLALAALGRGLDMQVLTGFVLCEWDKKDILRRVPSATWMGADWTVSPKDQAQKENAASILRQQRRYIEFGIHGLGHEFWKDGRMQRTEFHDDDCRMRHEDDIKSHLDGFFEIMSQYGFDFKPRTFIPPGLRHSFGDSRIQKILSTYGIRQVPLVFHKARLYSEPQTKTVAWENDVLLVERGLAGHPWHRVAAPPKFAFNRPMLALHWANILHTDPEKNLTVVENWVRFVKEESARMGILVSRDSRSCFTQYLHKTLTTIEYRGGEIILDVGWMKKIPSKLVGNTLYMNIRSPRPAGFQLQNARRKTPRSPFEEGFVRLEIQAQADKIILIPNKRNAPPKAVE